ncbi:MAG: sulfatase [Sphaerochaetaceae bacterium]|nr:sulfatase [Sphaerochaetaceae bacterium]
MNNEDGMQVYLQSFVHDSDCANIKDRDNPLPKQNVIWIIADQLRAQALSCAYDPNVRTPNLDNLALNGVVFNHAVSSFPICCPFRATLLTGQDHQQCMPGHQYMMTESYRTIADAFNEYGYDTAYFGKWHIDGARDNPMMHIVQKERRGGFRTWIGYENNNMQWNTYVHGHTPKGEIPQHRLLGYETDELTSLLIDYLKNRDESKPFFAVLSVQPPHVPHPSPARNRINYDWEKIQLRPNVPLGEARTRRYKLELARYYSMIENLDENIGRIMNELCMRNLDTSTQIMFFSDHGDMMGSHGLNGKVVPYEESIRIPFIISSSAGSYFGFKSGTCDALISEYDIAATTLGLCGIPQPDWLNGYDYSYYRYIQNGDGLSRPKKKEDEPASMEIKAIVPREGCDKAWRGVVTRDGWKYVCYEGSEWMLFNLNDDPYEQINLVNSFEYRGKRMELLKELKSWLEKNDDPFILPEENDL